MTPEPLAIDQLLTDDQRRPSVIEKVIVFHAAIESPSRVYDSIDEDCDFDPILIDRPAQRRSGRETNRVLEILDELAGEEEGWDA